MKRTITLFLLLLLLLPAMAQKPFTARVVAGKDYPYYITSVQASLTMRVDNEGNERRYDYQTLNFGKQDNRTYTLSYDAKCPGCIRFRLTVVDQQGVARGVLEFLEVPCIPGEQLTVTLHDIWDLEIGGSQLYREYGNAWRSILLQDKPAQDYIARHRKERGCALFVLSEHPLPGVSTSTMKRIELFKPAVISFLGDVKDPDNMAVIMCNHETYEKARIRHLSYDPSKSGVADIEPFDRQLEGQAIIDAVGQKHKGKPTLVSVWTYDIGNNPDAYELYLHAAGMNQIHLTSVSSFDGENSWRYTVRDYPGTHHLLMRYQVDSLFQLYMPGIEYSITTGRHFYILLDAEGKVVAHGDRRHGYRELIDLADKLKAQAGLPPFKEKPYEIKYLDLGMDNKTGSEKNGAYDQARMRMSYHDYLLIEGHDSYGYSADVRYTATAKQLNISQRLYDLVSKGIEEQNRQTYDRALQNIKEREKEMARQKDGYKPDLEPYRKDMAVGHPVDLGLSIQWADMNVGAKTAEETGMYFTWGDPEPIQDTHTGRNWRNYRWSNGSAQSLRKYNTKSENGAVDMRTTVLAEDDAAAIYWQGGWRTPTYEEADELWKKCTWERTEQNGVKGYRVTGPNGNSIFLPYTGCLNYQGLYGVGEHGYFWTSSINTEEPQNAYYLAGHSYEVKGILYNFGDQERYAGRCIRPVYQRPDNQ